MVGVDTQGRLWLHGVTRALIVAVDPTTTSGNPAPICSSGRNADRWNAAAIARPSTGSLGSMAAPQSLGKTMTTSSAADGGMTTDARSLLLSNLSEAAWQKQVMEWAKRGGWLTFHASGCQHYKRNARGFPDLVLLHPERRIVFFAELKTEHGKATTAQIEWLAALNTVDSYGAQLWRPRDWQEIQVLLLGGTE